MTRLDAQLKLAIEDNVAWCRIVCAAHSLDEHLSETVWANLCPSPRFYPNIITRKRGTQVSVMKATEDIRRRGALPGWGIKDSYADLDLRAFGFNPVVDATWYVRLPSTQPTTPIDAWAPVKTESDLLSWEDTWSGGQSRGDGKRTFLPALLNDESVGFWQKGLPGPIQAGFISHRSSSATGLSNWFSANGDTQDSRSAATAAASLFPERPVVFWSQNDTPWDGATPIGRLRIWISIV
jgi:hypothetical protein